MPEPKYSIDDKWTFNREWNLMKKRVDDLERKVYWLERWKSEMKEKQIQQEYKDKA
jgi:hypothetical protein